LNKTTVISSFFVMKGIQNYATKVFYSEKHAIDFKNRLGENCKQTIKKDALGRFKVRFLIDKTTTNYEIYNRYR
jgi:hypothetical protein